MAIQKIVLELPDDLVELLGSPAEAAEKAREGLVIELLREARISQGLAARLLGMTRGQMLDLMAERKILSGPETVEELRQEVEGLQRFLQEHPAHGSDQ